MDLSLTEEQKMLKTLAHDFAQSEVEPRAAELDETDEFPVDIFKKMAGAGFTGMTIPSKYGGGGADLLSYALVVEEIARASAAVAGILNTHLFACTQTIYRCGTEEQKRRFLPPMVKGEKIGAFSVTESEAGSDMSRVQTTASRDGDSYVINGSKVFVTHGGICDLILVFANIKELSPRGMTAFIVDRNTPGLSVEKKNKKLGMHAMDNCDLAFQDCRVPAANRLGDEGSGMKISLQTLDFGRIAVAAQALGLTQAILDRAIDYSKQRIQFGSPISRNQGISFKLADIATGLEAARALTHRVIYLAEHGAPFRRESAMVKLITSELCMKAAVDGIQVHGGYGYMMDLPMQRYFRDAKLLEIYEGTSEIQRIVIAESLLR